MSGQCSSDACSSCGVEGCKDRKGSPEDMKAAPNKKSNVKKVIGIMSGKGGVGKSFVTSLMAVSMAQKGFHSGILDGDITGPSIPKVFGIDGGAKQGPEGIYPAKSTLGIDVMSMNLLLENTTDPVVWRGPVIAGVVKQFWTDVIWEDVDYLFVDMPPGTGDVPLTIFQSLPVDGIIVVTSPQDLVSMIVEKAVKMAGMMNIPILGLVQNMAYFICSDCGKEHDIFGNSGVEEIAEKYNIPNTARIPMEPAMAQLCDKGKIEEYNGKYLQSIAQYLIQIRGSK